MSKTSQLLALQLIGGISLRQAHEMVQENQVQHSTVFDAAHARAKELLSEHWRRGIHTLSVFDEAYPASLRSLSSQPSILYVRGELEALNTQLTISIVGTRSPSAFGISATEAITQAFARAGFTTISGLALGIDTICHTISLRSDAKTVAVLSSGLDYITPARNRPLAKSIVLQGALISEHPLGTPPSSTHFIARNRLQAALGQALVVGQTSIKSGTMHTVRFAVELGRPIWCPRPQAEHKTSAGVVALLDMPGRELPHILPAFAKTSDNWRKQHLSDEPLARELTREVLQDLISELNSSPLSPSAL